MKLPRRRFLYLAAGAATVPAASRIARAQAQDFPAKPVRIITHSAPGGSPDALLRIVADRLSQMWGRQVLALNHPGAGGAVAARTAAAAAPDGYTLYMPASSAFVTLPGLQANLPLEVPRDFVPVGFVGEQPLFLSVTSSLGVTTLPEFIALAVGSTARLSDFPDLPTAAETLPGFNARGWLALVAPVGTPDAIVRKLSDDLSAAVTDPATKTKLETTGNYPHPMTPTELLSFIHAEQQM